MQKSDCIIGVEHVSKFFGDKAVLNDVNLSVRPVAGRRHCCV